MNLPLFLTTGVSLFGSMFLYFARQAAAVLVEHRWHGKTGRWFVWLAVVVPAPLVLNEGTLRIFHLCS